MPRRISARQRIGSEYTARACFMAAIISFDEYALKLNPVP